MEYNFNISPISMGVILFQCYDIKIKIITTDKVFFFFWPTTTDKVDFSNWRASLANYLTIEKKNIFIMLLLFKILTNSTCNQISNISINLM